MSKEKWSDAMTRMFISRYIKQPSLWNVSDPDYALKTTKEQGYRSLQDEFGLTLTEVRNKIRIYRTTYAQELKKVERNPGYNPKLTWFQEMFAAFNQGKIKSFTKTPSKSQSQKKVKSEPAQDKMMIQYQEDSADEEEEAQNQTRYAIRETAKTGGDSEQHHIIIEPYDEEYEDEADETEFRSATPTALKSRTPASTNASTPSGPSGMQSNELFLKSLQATLDKLPDDKNMRARIRIQEILYTIAYEK